MLTSSSTDSPDMQYANTGIGSLLNSPLPPTYDTSGSGSLTMPPATDNAIGSNGVSMATPASSTVSATGGGTTGNVDPYSSQLSPVFGDYVMDALGKQQALSSLPFQDYTGQRYADMNSLQNQALGGIAGLTLPSGFGAASSVAGSAANKALNMPTYQAGSFGTSNVSPTLDASNWDTVQKFMNPYYQGVVDISKREAQRSFDAQKAARDAAAVKAGAFGGSRQGINDMMALRDFNTLSNDIQTKGGSDAYTQAMAALQGQRSTQLDADKFNAQNALQAQQMGEQSRQYGAGLGLQGLNTALSGANTLGNLSNQQLQGGLNLTNAQWNAGKAAQDLDQRNLDFGYQQFQDSLNDPQKKISAQLGALQGLPINTSPKTIDSPNAVLEALLAGGGIYSLLGGKSGG